MSGGPIAILQKRFEIQYSPHFHAREFVCRCHGRNKGCPGLPSEGISRELIEVLERIRVYFDSPVHILSGYRCPEHNAAVGGVPRSRHKKGDAADIVVRGVDPATVYDFACRINPKGGVGKYISFTHIDTRGYRSRWTQS